MLVTGTGTSGAAVDGTGHAIVFTSPSGISASADTLYVTDSCTVRAITISGFVSTTLLGTTASCGSSTDGTGAAVRLFNANALSYDINYGLHVLVADDRRLRRMEIGTQISTNIAGARGATGATDGIG